MPRKSSASNSASCDDHARCVHSVSLLNRCRLAHWLSRFSSDPTHGTMSLTDQLAKHCYQQLRELMFAQVVSRPELEWAGRTLGAGAPPHKSYGACVLVAAPCLLSPGTDLMNELCDRNSPSEFGHARVLRYILDGLSSAVAVWMAYRRYGCVPLAT